MSGLFDRIKHWFGGAERAVEHAAEGEEPVSTPPEGVGGDPDRETSTNAQTQGASGQPWPGED